MKDRSNRYWIIFFSVLLCAVSAAVYYLQIAVFRNPRDTFFYLFQDLAFVPVQVLLVSLFLNELMTRREKKLLLGKMNMVIGVFFSEVGSRLLSHLAVFDVNLDEIRATLQITAKSTMDDFRQIESAISAHRIVIDINRGSIGEVRDFLVSRHGFMTSLLENQNLLEHESFTEMLWAIFHMMEELECRSSLDNLPGADLKHLEGDILRAYGLIRKEWLSYVKHLKTSYPYIYSLVVRMNPFNSGNTPLFYS